jgi:hypothetical protein
VQGKVERHDIMQALHCGKGPVVVVVVVVVVVEVVVVEVVVVVTIHSQRSVIQ